MIRLSLGNVGSGKTVSEVREMITSPLKRLTYTNIRVSGADTEHIKMITPEMILTKKVIRTIKKKDGTLEDVEEMSVNVDFWKNIKEPVNIVLDEAHTLLDSRRSFSKKSVCINRWLALIRRVLGDTEGGNSEVIFISQLSRKVDVNLREMCHNIRWHICYYQKCCTQCGFLWPESSDSPELIYICPKCRSNRLIKKNHKIRIMSFSNIHNFELFKDFGDKSYYKEIMINDISKYFMNYDTLQWEGLFENY